MMWDMLFQHHRSGTGYLFPAATTRDKLLMAFGFRFQRFGRRRGRPCLVLARVTDACERVSCDLRLSFASHRHRMVACSLTKRLGSIEIGGESDRQRNNVLWLAPRGDERYGMACSRTSG
jgi:hypothetical protein